MSIEQLIETDRGRTVINLSGQGLKSLPENALQLTGSTHLLLAFNQFEHIPEIFDAWPDLELIDLSSNRIKRIPDSIGHSPSLKHLYLRNNQIDELPESTGPLPKLEVLDLDHNRLKHIPENTEYMPNLKHLYIRHNQIEKLPDSLARLGRLEVLALDNNPLEQYPSEYFSEYFESAPNLKEMYLDSEYMPSLKELHIGSGQLEHIPPILRRRHESGKLEIYADGQSVPRTEDSNNPDYMFAAYLKNIVKWVKRN